MEKRIKAKAALRIFHVNVALPLHPKIGECASESTASGDMRPAELSLTNRIEEGSDAGTFGEAYPGYSWNRTITEYTTNGLYQVDFQVTGSGRDGAMDHSEMSILLFRPDAIRRAGR